MITNVKKSFVVVILGPRQCGKTTAAKQYIEKQSQSVQPTMGKC